LAPLEVPAAVAAKHAVMPPTRRFARLAACAALISAAAGILGGGPALATAAPGRLPARPPCRPGLTTVTVPTPAGVHVADDHVDVLLPADYCLAATRRLAYPVLYLLHGTGDTYSAWVDKTDVVGYARSFDVIIVMPDGGHGTGAGWYSNWLDGEFQYETYDLSVLPAYIDSHFRARSDDLAVAGNSMGGFGAMSYAARHPGMFKAAASFSGADDTLYAAPVSGVAFAQLNPYYGTPGAAIWGDQTTDYGMWAAHDPATLAARLRGTRLFLASGTGTPGGAYGDAPTDPGDYALENGIFQMNLSMVGRLDEAGVAHTDDFYPGGYHGWPYWQADLHWALPQIARILAAPAPAGRSGRQPDRRQPDGR
jgi:diacylglycerol O-acyltransferase/trehalose O-mycolyltransferase